ncbi:hypothetical protein FHR92_004597 [Fontibacillus solani]|uniref:Uncharacterized protein n=1 Tax=Fontibacillus solani TaxID=1572857 RepID=A0A7W3XTZ5_9BACL|nr:hypothetical protein [Fontibacillus solani]MBA9088101.1 hypothetical protein [Fontibacillus solani]
MSDFMKSIVEEALGRRTPARSTAVTADLAGGNLPLQSKSSPAGIAGLSRPNYQREKRNKRLAAESCVLVNGAQPASPPITSMSENFVEQALSPLLRLSLHQGKSDVAKVSTAKQDQGLNQEQMKCDREFMNCSGMIGQCEDGMSFWFYPNLHQKLASEFGIYGTVHPVMGIVTAEQCLPSQLLIYDKLVSTTSLENEVKWSKDSGSEFFVRLSGSEQDAPIMMSVLKQWQNRHKQLTERAIAFHESLQPSPRVTKLLGIAPGEALTVVEGLSRLRSIALLDRCFKHGLSSRLRYRIENRYLIVTGEPDEIREASSVMLSISEPYMK